MKNRTFKQLVMRSVSGIFIVLFASLGLVACGGGSSGGNASQGGDIPVSVKVDTKLTDGSKPGTDHGFLQPRGQSLAVYSQWLPSEMC